MPADDVPDQSVGSQPVGAPGQTADGSAGTPPAEAVAAVVTGRERLGRDVLVLGVVAFFVMVGFGVVVPVLPVYAQSFGVDHVLVGAVLSAFALMRLVASPFVGRMIDLAGERVVLGAGIGIVALSSGLAGVAADYPQLLLLRGLGGIGSAMFTISAMTLLLASTPPHRRARSIGFYQGGFLVGGMAGPAIGGVLSTVSLTAPFFFYAATLAVAGLVGVVLLRPGGREAAVTGEPPTPLREVLRDVRFRAACVASFAQGWSSLGVRSALVPVLVVEVLRGPTAWTGILFAVAAVAQTVALAPASRYVDRVGRRPAVIGSFAVAAVSLAAVPFAPHVVVLGALLAVYGVATAFMGTAPAALVGDAAGARGGRPVAIFSMCSDVGAIAGPLVAGLLVDSFSYGVAFGVAAALLAAASLAAVRIPRERARAS
ncbi:putative MFS family arabinose efflux permease [Frigoribacterium sp. PhB160]|uniref:MFS transporter n=1 Tax=Frigoribacterium sp. PhB160 TaxID=2485192 RepID=UPI000F46E449|nr:MFS transporter [Frigoribacterium sp. PhB160]ROS62436.1 putative MFS family arabinose efflux permease [Frigoribacterium sp. PhB160]